MTMQAPDMEPAAQYAYYEAILFSRSRAAALRVVNAVTDRLTEGVIKGVEALEKSSGLVRPEPLVRLQWYRQKPQLLWEEQLMKFPRDWEEDWRDWQNLRQRALEGDFGPVELAAEAMLKAQADLTVTE